MGRMEEMEVSKGDRREAWVEEKNQGVMKKFETNLVDERSNAVSTKANSKACWCSSNAEGGSSD